MQINRHQSIHRQTRFQTRATQPQPFGPQDSVTLGDDFLAKAGTCGMLTAAGALAGFGASVLTGADPGMTPALIMIGGFLGAGVSAAML